MKLSDYVFSFISAQGVKHVFLLSGGSAMHLVDSLGRCDRLKPVCLLHEQACAIAAEAYARLTDNLGVVLVTSGPGGTNAITGIAGAWFESTPVLVLSGQVKRIDMKRDTGVRQLGIQENDIIAMVSPVTKYAVTVEDPAMIRYHLEKAVFLAQSGRPGPAWIDIPLDVQAACIEPDELTGFKKTPETGSERHLLTELAQKTIEFLNTSERPVLLGGQGILRSHARSLFRQLVNTMAIPVLTTWMAADLVPGDHELYFGRPGLVASRGSNFAVQNCDFLLSIGARLDYAVTGFDQGDWARKATKIIVDIDQHELRKMKTTIDLPICSDAGLFISELLRQRGAVKHLDRSRWLRYCSEIRERYPLVLPEYHEQKDYVNMYLFTQVLSEELADDEIVIPGSSGAFLDVFCVAYRLKSNQRFICTGGLGAMGFAIPASIGGCIATDYKRIISVDGDGGFQLNIQELQIVKSLNLPIKYFVINNQGYAAIRAMQRNHFHGHLVACDSTSGVFLPNIVSIAEAYGIPSLRICNQDDLRQTIREALDAPGPIVCEVLADPDQPVLPKVISELCPDGSMRSRPLEDMWPFLDRFEFDVNMAISKHSNQDSNGISRA